MGRAFRGVRGPSGWAGRLEGHDRHMTQSATHTCPYCKLAFLLHNEVKDHITHDHPEHAQVAATAEIREMPSG